MVYEQSGSLFAWSAKTVFGSPDWRLGQYYLTDQHIQMRTPGAARQTCSAFDALTFCDDTPKSERNSEQEPGPWPHHLLPLLSG